ncbi:MAG: pyridoxamine 5'-phosphate oxidase family protein [Chloroflexota bacterium]
MAKFYSELNDNLRDFIAEQKMFFTATAPTAGRINLSPKGMDTLRCLDNKTVVYLDVTGSGNETAAHLLENGRLTLMVCSFSEKPMILRMYGHGRVIHPRDAEWTQLYSRFEPLPGARQIMVLDIETVQTSCGFGVPTYEFKQQRDMLPRQAEQQGEVEIAEYQRQHNRFSIDGLPTGLWPD